MDPNDIACIEERANILEDIYACGRMMGLSPEVLEVAVEAIPDDECLGYVVVWTPFREGDFTARHCGSRLGVMLNTWRARRQHSSVILVLDVGLTWRDSW